MEVADRATQAQPRSLILYLYGGFVRRLGGWLAVSSLVDLMADLGVGSQPVRAAISRMKSRALLSASQRGGLHGYALTPRAWQILEDGDRRILTAREPASLVDGWVLVVFSVPESKRDQRHQIRSELTWLGFGTVASGVWIAPRRLRSEVEAVLTKSGLIQYADIFDASPDDAGRSRELVERCWDLDGLQEMYRQFAERWEPVLRRWLGNADELSPKSAFRHYVGVVADWRRLPFLDPGLPTELLPDGWEGDRARWIYFSLLARIDPAALRYVQSRAGGAQAASKAFRAAADPMPIGP
jgi:phenylacetic acid degradation operon negative regulatory protein